MQKVVPAILTNDLSQLREQLEMLEGKVSWVQIDIMDGEFVPTRSVRLSELQGITHSLNLEIHLMVKNPEVYFASCSEVGAKRVYFHLEGTQDPAKVLSAMKQYDFQKGIAINPETAVKDAAPFFADIDALLLLSVVPGAQGHEFIPQVTEKVAVAKALKEGLLVGMDGGISKDNIETAFEKGADYVVVGSSIWRAQDPLSAFNELSEMVR